MKHNYHTHTFRCNHASGTDREYVERAIENGMKTLGFSDHAPYLFPFKDYYSFYRMKVEEIEEYADSVRTLAKEYEKDIRSARLTLYRQGQAVPFRGRRGSGARWRGLLRPDR